MSEDDLVEEVDQPQTLLVEPDGSTLITVGQVAEYLGISKFKARNLMSRGAFGAVVTQDDKGEMIHPSVLYVAVRSWAETTAGEADGRGPVAGQD